ncbi:MAG: PEGA domain-containing protein [Planctomycetes bacterium]|nr:PEGA domain-containing protein [Planctomycetota bacterium]
MRARAVRLPLQAGAGLRRAPRILLLALLSFTQGGCTTWALIESEPAGAEIRVNGKGLGTTPATVPLRYWSAWTRQRLELTLPGREPHRVDLERRMYWGYLVGDIFGLYTLPLIPINTRGPHTYYHVEIPR